MPTFYLTFGYATPYGDNYQTIHAPDYHSARQLAFDKHGNHWAFCYDEDDKPDAIDKYNLTPLPEVLGVLT